MTTNICTISEECTELKNIKYKSLMMNGTTWPDTKSSNNLSNLDTFLENEKNNNITEPWSKLDKTMKTKKILCFAEQYKKEKELSEGDYTVLIAFLKDCLDRKKLHRVKDVTYDKITGQIKDIPGLFHNRVKNHFTIKNIDKRVSTLKSLAPKKTSGTGTIKNLSKQDADSD